MQRMRGKDFPSCRYYDTYIARTTRRNVLRESLKGRRRA